MSTSLYPLCVREVSDPRRLRKLVPRVLKHLKRLQPELKFNAIAAKGLSGLLLAPIIAYEMKLPLIAVRQSMAGVHSFFTVQGEFPDRKMRYIIIDDLIDTGNTVKRMVKSIERAIKDDHVPTVPELVGVYLYDGGGLCELDELEARDIGLPKVPIFWPVPNAMKRLTF